MILLISQPNKRQLYAHVPRMKGDVPVAEIILWHDPIIGDCIGYRTNFSLFNRGIMTRFLRNSIRLDYIPREYRQLWIADYNLASITVARKARFVFVGEDKLGRRNYRHPSFKRG